MIPQLLPNRPDIGPETQNLCLLVVLVVFIMQQYYMQDYDVKDISDFIIVCCIFYMQIITMTQGKTDSSSTQ